MINKSKKPFLFPGESKASVFSFYIIPLQNAHANNLKRPPRARDSHHQPVQSSSSSFYFGNYIHFRHICFHNITICVYFTNETFINGMLTCFRGWVQRPFSNIHGTPSSRNLYNLYMLNAAHWRKVSSRKVLQIEVKRDFSTSSR